MQQQQSITKLVHDARAPLNQISMQAELIKMMVEQNAPLDKIQQTAAKIIQNCQKCSEELSKISEQARK
ncbi:hypothetical protein DS2_06266 [Catenovulum agarivorans DS-2]|uniref:Histidine kinase n=1 Tax=Catenovulum agarivorans DS-2 TaxID=1328313 RepID=W7QSM4_9ALTE|nr:hypothetical protein DS2_06266 [Catenovulum agarivorans DS-2]